jgi:hypothetical protein
LHAIVRAVTTAPTSAWRSPPGRRGAQQFDALAGIGCTEVQGILFSPSVPGDVVMDMLRTMSVLAHATLPSAASEPAAAAEPVTAW